MERIPELKSNTDCVEPPDSWFIDQICKSIIADAISFNLLYTKDIILPKNRGGRIIEGAHQLDQSGFLGATPRGLTTVIHKVLEFGRLPRVSYTAKQDRFYTEVVPFLPLIADFEYPVRLSLIPYMINNGFYHFASVVLPTNTLGSMDYIKDLDHKLEKFPVQTYCHISDSLHHIYIRPSIEAQMKKRFYDSK